MRFRVAFIVRFSMFFREGTMADLIMVCRNFNNCPNITENNSFFECPDLKNEH